MLPLILAAVFIVFLAGSAIAMPTMLVSIIGHLLAARPDDVEGWCYYGSLLDRTGNQTAAVRAYRTALQLNPTYTECWGKLAGLLERMGDFEGAAEAYRFME